MWLLITWLTCLVTSKEIQEKEASLGTFEPRTKVSHNWQELILDWLKRMRMCIDRQSGALSDALHDHLEGMFLLSHHSVFQTWFLRNILL
ncbi:Valine--tRNA ligase [Labeo rohita]|uniref:Valine--tRNA ligase n=1 Tax=Labeo rohita TaxID=84645 RepID=A0ABQ8L4L8_LABRO|nr:Valine--tRNA ligase [Labeo rohita]